MLWNFTFSICGMINCRFSLLNGSTGITTKCLWWERWSKDRSIYAYLKSAINHCSIITRGSAKYDKVLHPNPLVGLSQPIQATPIHHLPHVLEKKWHQWHGGRVCYSPQGACHCWEGAGLQGIDWGADYGWGHTYILSIIKYNIKMTNMTLKINMYSIPVHSPSPCLWWKCICINLCTSSDRDRPFNINLFVDSVFEKSMAKILIIIN